MPMREFDDSRGRRWRVWETRPTTENVRPDLRAGWLTFEHHTLRKRLAPIPDGWADFPDDQLRVLCGKARAERRHPRPRAE